MTLFGKDSVPPVQREAPKKINLKFKVVSDTEDCTHTHKDLRSAYLTVGPVTIIVNPYEIILEEVTPSNTGYDIPTLKTKVTIPVKWGTYV